MKDIYVYDGSNVLKNKLNIQDPDIFADAEANYVSMRLRELAMTPLKGNYGVEHFLQMHYYIFHDIYDWAGMPRKVNIEKSESVLGGMSVEYSDITDIVKDIRYCLTKLKDIDWKQLSKAEVVEMFSDSLAYLWKIHAFREGNTRTAITFMCQYADSKITEINRSLFEENSAYVRTALVAYNAYFYDGSNFQKKEYLYNIVEDALFN